ncbi:glycoside hydrolase family 38 protein, partial [Pisolithus albus]
SYPEINYGNGAKWIKNLTQGRLSNFLGGHFADVNLSSKLFVHRLDGPGVVDLQVWSAPGLTKPLFAEALRQKFRPAKKGESFGPSCTNHWWKVKMTIPSSWKEYERVQLEFDPDCEAMIFSTDGVPLQGITGGYGGDRRVEHIIPREAVLRGIYEVVIESSCNGMFGVPWNGDTIAPPDMNRYFKLASADLVVPNQEAWRLMWDFNTLRELVDTLPGNSPLQNKALVTANAIMNAFTTGDDDNIKQMRAIAEDVFGKGWEAKGPGIYDEGARKAQVVGISYCHIDTAWLWPYAVTQQKTARSWSTQIDLMGRYPEHRFACSQAQQFKWLEQQYPPLFEKLKRKVASGQFHLIGGAWVENDGNLPSGEALVRQFLYGQRYFQSRFGKRCETAWLPDSFGLTAAYPQLIRDSDGTQVLCHMTPVGKSPRHNLESNNTALLVFGNGDGGGGALPKMLENLRRIRAVTNNHRELPPVSMGSTVEQFFEDIERDSKGGRSLPVWRGELYLERVATLATICQPASSDYVYPKKSIDDCWEKVLLNQLLPGSAIGMVYDDAERLYSEVRRDCQKMLDEVFGVLLTAPSTACGDSVLAGKPSGFLALNLTPFSRQEVVEVPLTGDGALPSFPTVIQRSLDGKRGYALIECEEDGICNRETSVHDECLSASVSVESVSSNNFILRTPVIKMIVCEGRITSIYDLVLKRELIEEGKTGGLVIFEDRPNYWDAWDVEIHHLEARTPLAFSSFRVVAQGPLRATIEARVKYGQSDIKVMISMDGIPATRQHDSRPLIKFDAEVDWHEKHKFLKFELPLNINNTVATYECQFGFVQRPTYKNTTLDAAKFEVCGHKYADFSEFGYGVAILSESKYGFACEGNVLRISLLRAATAPDADQDQGLHEFSWAVMPHVGSFLESDVPRAACLFNSPLHVRAIPRGAGTAEPFVRKFPFSLHGARNVFLETVKRGEDDDFESPTAKKTVVLRLYEAFGGYGRTELRISRNVHVLAAYTTNLLEDTKAELAISRDIREDGASTLDLEFRGFEVKTVKLVLADDERSRAKHSK